MNIRRFVCFALLMCGATFAVAQELIPPPEAASGMAVKSRVLASRHMVVAAHPLAAEAGREILRAGGSATDAAIAVQLVLGLVEPQSSGLGGGAFLVHWDEAEKTIKTYDGRETAPAAAKPDRFMRDGGIMKFDDAMNSGLSVGVPGTVKLLEHIHKQHGKLAWKDLFQTGDTSGARGLSRIRAPQHAASSRRRSEIRRGRPPIFLRCVRNCPRRRRNRHEPRIRCDARGDRREGRGCVLRGTHRRGHRCGGRRCRRHQGRSDARGPQIL